MCDNFEDLMVRVQTFLAYPGNKKHTLDQLFAMVPYGNAVVAQYVKRFKSVFSDVVRMRTHGFGDVTFNVGHVKFDAEFKLVQNDLCNKHCGTHFLEVPSLPEIPANCPSDNDKFECTLYRSHHVIDECIRFASVVFCVVLISEETALAKRCTIRRCSRISWDSQLARQRGART